MTEDHAVSTRAAVLIPGHCSACRGPAEQHAISGNWWHRGGPCRWRSVVVFQPVEITPCPGGFAFGPAKVDLPARFIPEETTDHE